MGEITTIGIDLAKHSFQLHGVDASGNVVLRRALRRHQLAVFFKDLPRCVIGMEVTCPVSSVRVPSESGH